MRVCNVEDCQRKHKARGLCDLHYQRETRLGTTELKTSPLEERFWSKVEKTDGCWLWNAAKSYAGYGRFKVGETMQQAHRVAYEWLVGPIPEGLHLDHLCRVRNCVNPEHLEPVTPQVNMLRGVGASAINAVKTHCVNGHEFNETNTYWRRDDGSRLCRACDRERHQRYRDEAKAS